MDPAQPHAVRILEPASVQNVVAVARAVEPGFNVSAHLCFAVLGVELDHAIVNAIRIVHDAASHALAFFE